MNSPTIIDTSVDFHDSADGLLIQHHQEIPQSFLDQLKEARNGSAGRPMRDFERVASIPVSVYEKWLREGYDAQKEPVSKTLAKMRIEGLEYFITTEKRI